MRIYEATIADLDGLASVFNNYRMFYRQDSDLEGAKVFLRNRIERKESVIFVAVEDGEYIGFTIISIIFFYFDERIMDFK